MSRAYGRGASGPREARARGARRGLQQQGRPAAYGPGRVGLRSLRAVGASGQQGRRPSRQARPRAGRSRRARLTRLRCAPAGVAGTLAPQRLPRGLCSRFAPSSAPGPPRPLPIKSAPPPASALPRPGPGRARSAGKRSPGPAPPRPTCGGEAPWSRARTCEGEHPGFLGQSVLCSLGSGPSPRIDHTQRNQMYTIQIVFSESAFLPVLPPVQQRIEGEMIFVFTHRCYSFCRSSL